MEAEGTEKLKVFNIDVNTARAACYIPAFGVIAAVVFLIVEKNRKLRWDAAQALALWVLVLVTDFVLALTRILSVFMPLVNLVGVVVLPLLLAIRASQKENTRLPYLAELADKMIK